MALILKHQSEDAFLTRLRDYYRDTVGDATIYAAEWILAAIQRGDITDTSMRNKFGKNVAAWNTFKADMRAMGGARNIVLAARGE